jgi:HEAT repeat protein
VYAVRKIMVFLILVSSLYIPEFNSWAQPLISGAQIPPNTSIEVRKQIERLYSSDPIERAWGAYNLGAMESSASSAVSFLSAILHDHTQLKWVGLGEPQSPGFPATCYLSDDSDDLHSTTPGREAAKALASIGDAAIDSLIDALKYKDELVQLRVTQALGMTKSARAVPIIITQLEKSEIPNVRCAAAIALGNADRQSAAEPLIMALQHDKDACVRTRAAVSLGWLKETRAIEPLIKALQDDAVCQRASDWTESPRSGAVQSLEMITGQRYGRDLGKWRAWWSKKSTK